MKTPTFLAIFMALGLVSCTSVKTSMKKVTTPLKAMAKANSERIRKIRLPGKRTDIPPIVAVRKKDLKEIKSGQEKIVALNRSKKSITPPTTYLPQDFDPSQLPVSGQLPSSGILPPLNPGGSTSAKISAPDGNLPADVLNIPELALPPEPEEEE